MAIAFFSTWTTYGTWLPGDVRGWYQRGLGLREPDPAKRFQALLRMTQTAITLTRDQRSLVEKTIAEHCAIRGWRLHSANCRSNHVHVVISAPGYDIEVPREQFKAWCTRRLNKLSAPRKDWWTDRGWDEYIDDDELLTIVIEYVTERQDWYRS